MLDLTAREARLIATAILWQAVEDVRNNGRYCVRARRWLAGPDCAWYVDALDLRGMWPPDLTPRRSRSRRYGWR